MKGELLLLKASTNTFMQKLKITQHKIASFAVKLTETIQTMNKTN